MNRTIIAVLCLVLVTVMFAGCGKTQEPAETKGPTPTEAAAPGTQEEVFVEIAGQKIEPLSKKTKVVFSTVGASAHSLPLYIAEKEGWLDELNIDLETISFDNGPIQMEAVASNSWDFGSTGQGGVFSGVIKYDTIILADLLSDDDGMRIYARADSPIAKAGKGHIQGYPDIYGTPETWKNAEVMVPAGTIAHYVLTRTIEKIGLTMDDIKVVNMSAANAKTALEAGQGDVASLMSNAAYFFDGNDDYVLVSSAKAVGGGNAIAMMVVNPNVLDDKDKMDAILKCMDVHFAVVDYMKTLSLEELVDYQLEMSESRAMSSDRAMMTQYMKGTMIYDFDKSYELQTTVSDDGELTLIERSIIDPLKFFVSLGNYTQENVEKMSSGFFPAEYMVKLKELRE